MLILLNLNQEEKNWLTGATVSLSLVSNRSEDHSFFSLPKIPGGSDFLNSIIIT